MDFIVDNLKPITVMLGWIYLFFIYLICKIFMTDSIKSGDIR